MRVRGERGSALYIGSVYMPTDTSVTSKWRLKANVRVQ